MKKILFLALLLSAWIKPAAAQDRHTIDSLKNLLVTAKEDTNKVKLYLWLAYNYTWSYPDSALLYLDPALQMAKKLGNVKSQVSVLLNMEEPLSGKGNFSKALQTSFQSLEIAEKLNDEYFITGSLMNIGDSYYYSGDYKNALVYYYKLKSDTAFFNRSRWMVSGFIGETYYHLNNLDSAFQYTKNSLEGCVKIKYLWPVPYFYMGKIYGKRGDQKKAVYYTIIGINHSTRNLEKADGYNYIAAIYKNKGDADSAIFYANTALSISMKSSLLSEVIDASNILTAIYKSRHLADSALKYQDMMLTAKDSVFSKEKIKQMQNFSFDEQMRQQKIIEAQEQYRSRVKMYALAGIVGVFLVLAVILWRNNRHKQKANEQIQKTLAELKTTQTQLIQSEKMASLGELTAGIAHEIQNPLNFVNNFSEVSKELMDELRQELGKGDTKEVDVISQDVIQNLEKIVHHGKRADAIVKGMLQHSQSGNGVKEPTNINAVAEECMRLAYHGLRAKDKSFNAEMLTHLDSTLPKINVIPQDMVRVMLNLFNNAFYAVNQKQKTADAEYKPEVTLTTAFSSPPSGGGGLVITVKDNGTGMQDSIKDKIMQPFFTTKPTGEGTGLGLSLTYDMVVKGHGGSIQVNSVEGEGSEFIINLPITN